MIIGVYMSRAGLCLRAEDLVAKMLKNLRMSSDENLVVVEHCGDAGPWMQDSLGCIQVNKKCLKRRKPLNLRNRYCKIQSCPPMPPPLNQTLQGPMMKLATPCPLSV